MAQHTPQPTSGISLTQRILGSCLLVIALVITVLVAMTIRQFNSSIQQQADALGEALITHTAEAVSAPLALADTLALAAVLRELVNNPYVVHAALYSVDNRTLAEAGRRPRQGSINSLYTRSIAFDQVIAGQLHINIDVQRLRQPLYSNLQGLALLGVLLLLVALALLSRIARSISQPLTDLQVWLTQPTGTAPHMQRGDEIGLLARSLDQHFSLPLEIQSVTPVAAEPAFEPEESEAVILPEDHSAAEAPAETAPDESLPEHCAALAIALRLEPGPLGLDEQRRLQVLEHYEEALEEVASIYQGFLLELADGNTLMLFHDDQEAYVTHALCAAELLRAFAHALQAEMADTGAAVSLQLGIAAGEAVFDLSEAGLLQHPAITEALELRQHSRNLVLLGRSVATHPQTACSNTRYIARPEGARYIERMLAPWPDQLDDQLQALMFLTQELDD